MASTLFLGLGGTGSRVIAKVAKELEKNHVAINDGAVCCAALDTHGNDFEYELKKIGVETPVPAVSADSAQTVNDLLHKHKEAEEWFVHDLPIMNMEMMYTASSVRMKTRLAFLEAYQSEKISPIQNLIEKMLRNAGGDIRVVLISSVENGMLMQTALWIRNQFKARGREVHLCGIILLPDIFASMINGAGQDDLMKKRLYANAYAAIRELNAVSKIKKNPDEKPNAPIRIDGLFDSEDMKNPLRSEKDVFDVAFLLDYETEDGSHLSSISEYEDQAARFAYMRLCSPIRYNEEKQAPLSAREGFSFGSFAVAKAVYPKEEVQEYCVLRALSDVIGGWGALEREAEAVALTELPEEERTPAKKYTKLFETRMHEARIDAHDPFFSSLNEESLKYKSTRFMENLMKQIRLAVEKQNSEGKGLSQLNALGIDLENTSLQTYHFVDFSKELLDQYPVDILKDIVESNEEVFAQEKRYFETSTVSALTNPLLNGAFPQNVSELDAHNEESVYGMLTVLNEETEERSFVHPVTARYLLNKLYADVGSEALRAEAETKDIAEHLEDLEKEVYFDYGRTKHNVETLYNYFEKPPRFWEGSADSHKQHFIKKYREYVQKQYVYGKEYEIRIVSASVLRKLEMRVKQLIEKLDDFFAMLPKLAETYEEKIRENLQASSADGTEMRVCASEKAKKAIYGSLDVKFDGSDKSLAGLVLDGVYGMLCAQAVPDHPAHEAYAKLDLMNEFSKEIFAFYAEKLAQTQKEKLNLDIYSALQTEAQSEGETDADTRMKQLTEKLKTSAVPYLQADVNGNRLEVNVWGFHPDLLCACPALGEYIGTNAQISANEAYPKNELSCCTAVYNLCAEDFPKLKEDGVYGTEYRNITEQINDSSSISLIQTPHIDKTWHKILPTLKKMHNS